MLRKLLLSLISVLSILFFSIYFYAEIYFKTLIKNQIDKINSSKIIEIAYDNISIKKNFLKPKFIIDNLKIDLNIQNISNKIIINKIALESDYSFSKLKFFLQDKVDLYTRNNAQTNQYLIHTSSPHIVSINLGQSLIFKKDIKISDVLKNLIAIEMNNFNFSFNNIDNPNQISKIDLNNFALSQTVLGDIRTVSHISNINYLKIGKDPLKINNDIAIDFVRKNEHANWYEFKSYKFSINKINLNTLNENLIISGKLLGDETELMPNGQINLTINNLNDLYKNFRDFYQLGNQEENLVKVKFLKILSYITDGASNNIIEIKRSKFGQVYINGKNLLQIASYYNENQ